MGSGFAKRKKQMKQFQDQVAQMQADIAASEVQGTAGGGLVTLTLTGQHELKNLQIKPGCVDPEDVEGLEDLIQAAYQDALDKLSSQTSGSLPDLGGLGFGI